jgi:hypothetical protein
VVVGSSKLNYIVKCGSYGAAFFLLTGKNKHWQEVKFKTDYTQILILIPTE